MYPYSGVANVTDALQLLMDDHREIDTLFERYEVSADDEVAHEVFDRLALHGAMEHSVLYPEVRRVVDGGDDLVDRAEAEHSAVQEMTAAALGTPPSDLRPLVADLAQRVRAHVEFEEAEIFPALREAGADLDKLGAAMEQVRGEFTDNRSASSVRTRRNV
jgi:hemerythrin superfamily protein